jgi:hypothetical protein
MEFIFPNIAVPEEYNYGSNSKLAPYLDTLLHTSLQLASKLNDILELYKQYFQKEDDIESMMFNPEWEEVAQNLDLLSDLAKSIPIQAGNIGAEPVMPQNDPPVTNAQPAPPVHQQMGYQAAPLPPQAAPVPQQQYSTTQTIQSTQAATTGSPVVANNRGIDFRSSMMNNMGYGPQVMYAPAMALQNHMGYPMPGPQMMYQQNQNGIPTPNGYLYPAGYRSAFDPVVVPHNPYYQQGYAPSTTTLAW